MSTMLCELLVTTKEGQILAGVIKLKDDGSVSGDYSDGYENLVTNVMAAPVLGIERESDSKAWFDGLPKQYTGSYFRAAKVGAIKAATEGVLFRGVHITGFTSIEEEQARAYMSRIPPELIVGVKQIVADPTLGAIHGRYDAKTE